MFRWIVTIFYVVWLYGVPVVESVVMAFRFRERTAGRRGWPMTVRKRSSATQGFG